MNHKKSADVIVALKRTKDETINFEEHGGVGSAKIAEKQVHLATARRTDWKPKDMAKLNDENVALLKESDAFIDTSLMTYNS